MSSFIRKYLSAASKTAESCVKGTSVCSESEYTLPDLSDHSTLQEKYFCGTCSEESSRLCFQ